MRLRRWLGVVIAGLTCVPVVLLSPFPTQDGPAHLYAGHVLRHLGDGRYTAINGAFQRSSSALSAEAVHRTLALLLGVLPPPRVEQLVALLCVGALFAVFIVAADDHPPVFPLCALPLFAMSFALRMGFYSFCLGLPLAVEAVRLWTDGEVDNRPGRLILSAGAAAALPFLHLLTAAWALALLGACSLGALMVRRTLRIRELTILALASVSFFAVAARYPSMPGDYTWPPIGERVAALLAGGAFLGAGRGALWRSAVPSMVLLSLGVLFCRDEMRRTSPADGAALRRLIAVFVALLLALAVPEEGAGGAYVGVRMNLLLFLLLLSVLGTWRVPRSVDVALSVMFLAFSAIHLFSTCVALEPASAAEREIMASTPLLQDHTTALVVVAGEWVDDAGPSLATQIRPLLHAGDLLGVGADRTILTFYEGELPYFPVNFTREANPFGVLFDSSLFGWGAPRVNWEGVVRWRGGVDYVAVWDEARLLGSPAEGPRYRAAVCAHYAEAHRSASAPWIVYQRRRDDDADRLPLPRICGPLERR